MTLKLRLQLFRCECGWQGQTYAPPGIAVTCPDCKEQADPIPSKLNDAGKLEPVPSGEPH